MVIKINAVNEAFLHYKQKKENFLTIWCDIIATNLFFVHYNGRN